MKKNCYNCGREINPAIWEKGFPYCELCWNKLFGGVGK